MLSSDPTLERTLRHTSSVQCVTWSPNLRMLASGCADNSVMLWSFHPQFRALRLQGHTGAINAVSFSPDGGLLASASQDGSVRLWKPSMCVPSTRCHPCSPPYLLHPHTLIHLIPLSTIPVVAKGRTTVLSLMVDRSVL